MKSLFKTFGIAILIVPTVAQSVDLAGTMPGRFSVSDTGQFQYSIPINTPAATAGMRPNLSLAYSHRGGNGIAGQGWTVSGLSKIARCLKTLDQDGVIDGIHYNLDDRFCLDGRRLVLTAGTYGVGGSQYRTEIDSFSKIVAFGSQGTGPGAGPQYFIVTQRDGTQNFYGHVNNSSVDGLNDTYSKWARYATLDTFQNQVEYFYNTPITPGSMTLDRIEYTTNIPEGLSPRYKVEFEYQTRPLSDRRSGFSFGVIWSKYRRLSKVTVQNLSVASIWETIHDYTLDYVPDELVVSGRSQLASVQQCEGTWCLPKTTLDWQNVVEGWEPEASSGQSSSGHSSGSVGDFDNDGQQDLYVTVNGEWHIIRASAGSFSAPLDTNKSATGSSWLADFNGDGMVDIVFTGSDSKYHVYQSTGTGFTEITTTTSTSGIEGAILQDADGDGRDDLIYRIGVNVYLRRSTGTDFESTGQFMMNTIADTITFRTRGTKGAERQVDFNGDGRGDILLKEKTITSGGGGRRGGGGGTITWEYVAYQYNDFGYTFYGALDGNIARYVVDINGDGLDDLAYYSSGSWRQVISTGTGFQAETSSSISDSYATKVVFADYDGDGRDDLIRATAADWIVHLSNGDGFESVGIPEGGPDPLNSPAIAMDVTGSGNDDLVMSHSNLWKVRDHKSSAIDVVTKITDGLGNYFEPTYEPISTSDHYSQTFFGSPPEDRSYQVPLYVVTDVLANNGTGDTYSHMYEYFGAKMHLRGRGFLGFRETRTFDYRGVGTRIFRNKFRQDFPYIGRLELAEIRTGNFTYLIKKTDRSWQSSQTFSDVYFVRPDTTTIIDYEIDGALNGVEYRTMFDDPTYDSTYGNVTQRIMQTTSTQAVGDIYTTTLNFQFANYTSPWCLGLPTQQMVTRSAPGVTSESRTVNNTFNASNCQLLTSTNVSEASTALQLKSTVTYDGYGNTKTIAQDSADGGAADRKSEFFYDSWGHLATSQEAYIDGLPNPIVSTNWDYKVLQPLSQTAVGGQVTSWQYDAFGRVTKETRPDLSVTDISYEDCIDCWIMGSGRVLVKRDDSDGFKVRNYYDRYGRSIGGWYDLPTGTSSYNKVSYNSLGQIDRRYVPWVSGEPSFYTDLSYDQIGRLTQENRPIDESSPSGAITTISHQGLTRTVTNAESQVTTYNLDPLGRVEKVTDDLGGETEYEFTVFDQLHKVWDPADVLTTINYNGRGDKISSVDPDSGSWSYGNNVFGELTSQTDAKSQSATFGYNQLGLMTSRIEDEGTTTWNYFTTADHKFWLPSSVSSPGFSESYNYDTLGRPSSVTTTIDSVPYTTDLDYYQTGAPRGKLERITYPTSTSGVRFKVDYDYDSWGQLSAVKNGDSPTTVYYQLNETDALGRERLATFENGLDEDRVYDRANGLLKTIMSGPNLSATVQNLSYQWDKLGNLTQRQEFNKGKREDFIYDDLNRVKEAQLNSRPTLTVNYNSVGNITFKSDVGTYTYGADAGPHAVTGITGLRPGDYGYDDNGNMTIRDGDAITWTSYNKPSRIVYGASDYAEFQYGPARKRFKQVAVTGGTTVTTTYVGAHFEIENSGGITSYRHNIMAAGRTVGITTRPTSGPVTTHYMHRDHLGSVVAITDDNGAIDQEFSFDAFGKRRNVDWTADTGDLQFAVSNRTERGYTDHEHLDNVRLIHMNGRVQDPIIGRMISADPFVPNPFDSQSFNRYSYVVNNPLSLIDPTGFDHLDGVPSLPIYDPDGCDEYWFLCETAEETPTVTDEWDRIEQARDDLECENNPGLVPCQGLGDTFVDFLFGRAEAQVLSNNVLGAHERIAVTAESYLGSTNFAFDTQFENFPPGTWKCNCFVSNVLAVSGVNPPRYDSGVWPVRAGDWANVDFAIPGWEIVGSPMRGDVAAFGRVGGEAGHVGIVVGNGTFSRNVIGAGRSAIEYSRTHRFVRFGFGRLTNAATPVIYRRWVGTGE